MTTPIPPHLIEAGAKALAIDFCGLLNEHQQPVVARLVLEAAGVAELLEDKERINHMNTTGKPETFEDAPHCMVWHIIGPVGVTDIRAAIDLARKANP